jgi:hypothetical protein
MLTHVPVAAAPRRAPANLPLHPPEPGATLLDGLGSVQDEDHIVVLGGNGADLMCALLRAGAVWVTHLRSVERLEADSVSLAIVPQVPSLEWLTGALPRVRRALMANGRVAVCVDILPTMQNAVRRMLTLHGFTAIRASRAAGRLVLRAEVPAFGIRRCA